MIYMDSNGKTFIPMDGKTKTEREKVRKREGRD